MSDPQGILSSVLAELARLQKVIKRHAGRQITTLETKDLIKSVAYSWFNSHRGSLRPEAGPDLTPVDVCFRDLLQSTDRATSKSTYLTTIAEVTVQLRELRSAFLIPLAPTSSDVAPNFSPLASDAAMQGILQSRWEECQKCHRAGAYLAATVMMGGLLEALFVARANAMPDKSPLFKAKSTPIDSKTAKPISLRDWTLRPYIDVAHELNWISRPGKDIAVVLRDYRNLVHPEKQRTLSITLNEEDSRMFWEVTKALSRQLLNSVSQI